MAIQNVPAFPLRSQGMTQTAYSAGVEASLSAIPQFISDLNAVGSAYALTTNGTSTTSVAIGTGSKSFTTQTNLGYLVGMTLRLAFDSVNYMTGDVTSYNTGSGALVVNVTSVVGSGTRTSWVITMAAVGANNAGSVSFTPAGNIAATNVQAAIQELDTEKLSNAAQAVTGTNLENVVTGATVGATNTIPVMTFDSKGRVTAATGAPTIVYSSLNTTTGGTTLDFTSIPSWATEITIGLAGLSTTGTSIVLIQIGDSGGVENTGYLAAGGLAGAEVAQTTGFPLSRANAAANTYYGNIYLKKITGNVWGLTYNLYQSNGTQIVYGAGIKTLSDTLDRVRVTTVNGTDTFDVNTGTIVSWR